MRLLLLASLLILLAACSRSEKADAGKESSLVASHPAVADDSVAPQASPQALTWPPQAPAIEVPLWPPELVIAQPVTTGPEQAVPGRSLVAGKPWTSIQNVSRPSMGIYPAKGVPTGTTVVVFPGGGYRVLAIDLEGTEICDWLTREGITCVVLKYRVKGSGHYYEESCHCHLEPEVPMARQDAQRAIRLLRQQAGKFGIRADRVGVIGFSAGGHLVADVSNHLERAYDRVDTADDLSSRPDFAIALYPGHLWDEPELALHPRISINKQAPPTFLLHAGNGPVDDVRHSLVYYEALQRAGVPVEMHLYAEGGHAFGLREKSKPIGQWPALVQAWLRDISMLGK